MTGASYKHFTDIYDYPYTIIVFIYILVKYIALIRVLLGCCYKCCSCNCWRKLTSWMVRIIFGGSEGVSELKPHKISSNPRTPEGGDAPTQEQGGDAATTQEQGGDAATTQEQGGDAATTQQGGDAPTPEDATTQEQEGDAKSKCNCVITDVYIQGVKVEGIDLDILGIIIVCFLLLLLLTMYTTYLLEVTFTCSEDPALYCFPQFINENDPTNPNISGIEQRITDCSDWTDPDVQSEVTFNCFRYVYNAKEALAVGGGLLAIFTVSMRTIISLMINAYRWMSKRICKHALCVIKTIVIIILSLINTVLFIMIMVIALGDMFEESSKTTVAQQVAVYVAENGVQLVIILGTVELLLLINWEHYTGNDETKECCCNKHITSNSTTSTCHGNESSQTQETKM